MLLLPCAAFAQFDEWFTDASLRVDYTLTGDAKNTSYALKELIKEPYWSGSKKNLIDRLDYGSFIVKVYEPGTDRVLFTKGYQNLFGEWQTTDEATKTVKTFEESAIVPFPKKPVEVVLYYKNWEGQLIEGYRLPVDPNDYFIRTADDLNLPVYDAWIGNADVTKAVDIVLLPEGYTQEEMGKFVKDCNFFVESLFAYAPYDRYRGSFNVRGVMAPSVESGCTEPGDRVYRNTVMRFSYWTFDSERYCMSTDNRDIRDLAGQVPYDQIYVLVNSKKYGGGGIYNFYCSSAVGNSYSSDIFIHEFGHGFAGLADEYYEDETGYGDFYNNDIEPWERNITTLTNFHNKWEDLIAPGIPVPTPAEGASNTTIGVFEGAGYSPKGVYRPCPDCRMRTNENPEFCKVCDRAIRQVIDFYTGE